MNNPDIIGKIPQTLATYDEQGNQLTPTVWLDGFHVNFPEEVPELAAYKLDPQPTTPSRIYAGNIMPVAYKFPDEQTFRQLFPEPEEIE